MTDSGPETASSDGVTPEQAFAILGDATRIHILRALWAAAPDSVPFGELRKRVGMRDSGQFNYHLDKLKGHFVRQTPEGYTLRTAGEFVVRAVLAGAITERPTFGPTEIDAPCPYCGATVEVRYSDEIFTARCTECVGVVESDAYPTGTFMRYNFPPAGVVDRTPDQVLAAAHTLYDAKLTAMLAQVCPECAGSVALSFEICSDHDPTEGALCPTCETRHKVWVRAACENCKYTRQFILWFAVVAHPAVIAFYHDHGATWNRIPFAKLTWENALYVGDVDEEIVSTDPLRIRMTLTADDDELQVVIDEELNVIEAT